MKFGSVDNPALVDLTLPPDHPDTVISLAKGNGLKQVFVGCAKWNRQDLKNFYPRGTKDELTYYSTQFNSIELNATFYNSYPPEQIVKWRDRTPEDFKFFPKVHRFVSHVKRLNNVEMEVETFTIAARAFENKLGMAFLQLHDNFKPTNMNRLVKFVEKWPVDIPLGIELRNTEWFNEKAVAEEVYKLFEDYGITNIITDTAGRRDLLHMRQTTPTAFIRYVGSNHESDYARLDDWLGRLKVWIKSGLENLYFFVHQNLEKESPHLSKYFIEKFNKQFGMDVRGPVNLGPAEISLFGKVSEDYRNKKLSG